MFEVIELGGVKTVTTKSACNHVYVVDTSGSMYRDLPKVRQNLKNIISMVAQPDDTFSVIWFSGRNECGVVFENVLVSDAATVTSMHSAIDRFLVPRCLTGFVDPIQLAMTLKLDPSKATNFIMMTDGYDNQSRKDDILTNTAELKSKYQNVSFIEYGYYADRDMLAQMAQAANGLHLFAEGVDNYDDVINIAVTGAARVPQIEVKVNKSAEHAVYLYNGQIRIVEAKDGVVSVPEDTDKVYSIAPSQSFSKLSDDSLYVVLFYAIKQNNATLAWKALEALEDTALVEAYENAFTKQELSTVEDLVSQAIFDVSRRWAKGRQNCVPNKNAKTVLDVLSLLADSDAKLVLDSPYWSYNKISKGTVEKEKEALPRFVKSPMARVSLRGLVFNSERPNISIGTTLKGVVELPDNPYGLKSVQSFIHRNYAIIKDGTKNVKQLPVIVNNTVLPDLSDVKYDVIDADGDKTYIVVDLSAVPVINRKRIEQVKVEDYLSTIVTLESYKAELKVVNSLIKEDGGSDAKIQGMIDQYGQEAAEWLSSIGVRDYGFSPVGTTAKEATDEYMSVQVDYKIKGLSSLPALNAVRTKVSEKKKLNVADQLINQYLSKYTGQALKDLEEAKVTLTEAKRAHEVMLADMNYTLILGRVWFSQDDVVTKDIDFGNGNKTTISLEKVRKVVKI